MTEVVFLCKQTARPQACGLSVDIYDKPEAFSNEIVKAPIGCLVARQVCEVAGRMAHSVRSSKAGSLQGYCHRSWRW